MFSIIIEKVDGLEIALDSIISIGDVVNNLSNPSTQVLTRLETILKISWTI
jgi:hypothetical protein